MSVSNLNIKINVNETKNNEEWVAQKKTNLWGDKTTIIFYQREKNQSSLQKIADFFTGVKPGREVAAKYINELGLNKPLSNPKNTPALFTDNELDQAFKTAAKQLETRPAFESTEPLVSHQGTDKKINIKINGKAIQNATVYRANLKSQETVFFINHLQGPNLNQSQNKISIASIELAVDIRENHPQSFNANDVAKAHKELTNFKTASKGQPWFNAELSSRLDNLIKALEGKLSSLNQNTKPEKSVQNDTSLSKKIERKVFLSDFEKLGFSIEEMSFTYLALVEAFNIRDKHHRQPSNKHTQQDRDTLTQFRDRYKTHENFIKISEKFDQLITVLENKLKSEEKIAPT